MKPAHKNILLDATALTGLTGLFLLLYQLVIFPWGRPVFLIDSDYSLQFYPWLNYGIKSVLSGQIPWWCPYSALGEPFVGKLETAPFFPGHWLLGLFFDGKLVPQHIAQLYQVAPVLLSGLAMYFLARELTGSRAGGFLSGALWLSSWDLKYHTVWTSYSDTMVFLPLVFLCMAKAVRTGRAAWFAAAALGMGLELLAGCAQWTLYHFLALGVVFLVLAWSETQAPPGRKVILALAPLACFAFSGILLAAVQLIPALELTLFSPRATPSLEFASANALNLRMVAHKFLTDIPFSGGGLWLLLVGMAPVLAFAPLPLALFLISLAAADLTRGQASWVYLFFFHAVPGFALFQEPGRTLTIACFAAHLLAGFSLAAIWRGRARLNRWAALAAGAALLGLALLPGSMSRTYLIQAGIMLGGLAVICLFWKHAPARRGIFLALALLSLATPLYFPHTDEHWIQQDEPFVQDHPLLTYIKAQPGLFRITNPGAFINFKDLDIAWPYYVWNYQGMMIEGVQTWRHTAQLRISRVDAFLDQTANPRLYDLLNIRYMPQGLSPPPTGFKYVPRYLAKGDAQEIDLRGLAAPDAPLVLTVVEGPAVLDLCRGGGTVTLRAQRGRVPVEGLPPGRFLRIECREGLALVGEIEAGGVKLFNSAPRWREIRPGLWENVHCLPRAFLAHRYRVFPEDEGLKRALAGLEPEFELLLEEEPVFTPDGAPARDEGVRVLEYGPHRVALDCRLTSPGLLFFGDPHFPGWKALVDGRAAPLYRADLAFRAVALGAGIHRVEFVYDPWWKIPAFLLSLAGLGLALGGGLWMARLYKRDREGNGA